MSNLGRSVRIQTNKSTIQPIIYSVNLQWSKQTIKQTVNPPTRNAYRMTLEKRKTSTNTSEKRM